MHIEGARARKGACTHRGAWDVILATFSITSKSFYFSLRLAHFTFRLFVLSTAAMGAASWRLRLGFVSEVDVLHLRESPLVFAVKTGESVSVTWAASREDYCEQKERQGLEIQNAKRK